MSDLVPFGKYKGQPVEAMVGDREYVEWLMAQDWFQQKYPRVYNTIIVNNYNNEPCDTPEHNAMQAKFLDPLFRFQVATAAFPTDPSQFLHWYGISIREWICNSYCKFKLWPTTDSYTSITEYLSGFMEAIKTRDLTHEIKVDDTDTGVSVYLSIESKGGKYTDAKKEEFKSDWSLRPRVSVSDVSFEDRATDVRYQSSSLLIYSEIRCEVKPCVGDDYPAIVRKMKANKENVMLVRQYSGAGVSKDVFVQFCRSAGIIVVFESDAEKITPDDLPRATREFLREEFLRHFR